MKPEIGGKPKNEMISKRVKPYALCFRGREEREGGGEKVKCREKSYNVLCGLREVRTACMVWKKEFACKANGIKPVPGG